MGQHASRVGKRIKRKHNRSFVRVRQNNPPRRWLYMMGGVNDDEPPKKRRNVDDDNVVGESDVNNGGGGKHGDTNSEGGSNDGKHGGNKGEGSGKVSSNKGEGNSTGGNNGEGDSKHGGMPETRHNLREAASDASHDAYSKSLFVDQDAICAAAFVDVHFDQNNINRSSLKDFICQTNGAIIQSSMTLKYHQVDFVGRAIMAYCVLDEARKLLEHDSLDFKARSKECVAAWNVFASNNTMYVLEDISAAAVAQCLQFLRPWNTGNSRHDKSVQVSQVTNMLNRDLADKLKPFYGNLDSVRYSWFKTCDVIRRLEPAVAVLAASTRMQLVQSFGIHSCLSESNYRDIKSFFSSNNVSHIFNVGGSYGMHSLLFDGMYPTERIKTTTIDPFLTSANLNDFYSSIDIPAFRKVSLILPRWLALDGKLIEYRQHTNNLDNVGVFISWPDGGGVFGAPSGATWLVPTLQTAIEQGIKYFVLVLSESAGLEAFNEFQEARHLVMYQVERTSVYVPALQITEEIIFIKANA